MNVFEKYLKYFMVQDDGLEPPKPIGCKPIALPTELIPHINNGSLNSVVLHYITTIISNRLIIQSLWLYTTFTSREQSIRQMLSGGNHWTRTNP